jgi:hypothetical protein
VTVDQLKSLASDYNNYVLEKIKAVPDKKFYLSLDMNYVKNPLVYDDTTFGFDNIYGEEESTSAQINNITFMLPSSPLIYQNKKIPQVKFK